MKTLKYILGVLVLAIGMSSCVGDLDVTPLDPALNTADKALQTEDDYFALLAQCYTGFAVSGSYGPNGANNISGVDGGSPSPSRPSSRRRAFSGSIALIWSVPSTRTSARITCRPTSNPTQSA